MFINHIFFVFENGLQNQILTCISLFGKHSKIRQPKSKLNVYKKKY